MAQVTRNQDPYTYGDVLVGLSQEELELIQSALSFSLGHQGHHFIQSTSKMSPEQRTIWAAEASRQLNGMRRLWKAFEPAIKHEHPEQENDVLQ